MKKRTVFVFIIPCAVIAAAVFFLAPGLPRIERSIAQRVLNQNAGDFFAGPVLLEKAALDAHFRLRLEGISGDFRTRQGPVSLEVKSLASQNSLLLFLVQKPVRFTFEGARLKGSEQPGARGEFTFRAGRSWQFELLADLNGTDLKDLKWIDPQNLSGATGATKGKVRFVQSAEKDPVFTMDLEAPRPGGMLQARFFDIFLPYLPQSPEKEKVTRLASEGERLVKYRTASLRVTMPQSDRMKILLQILVLDYNLKLTLNADIRTDSKDAFFQIARIMGLIEVKTS